MVKPRIACYITGGWTECGYMTHFLNEINDKYDYRQRFPQKSIGKKGKKRKFVHIEGTTGEDLIKAVYSDLREHKKELVDFEAILIEDDVDDNYFLVDGYGRDYEKIEKRKTEIETEIQSILGKDSMPIFFLYAIPEIEAWFLADWDHTFGEEYFHLLKKMNSYFSTTFRKFIMKQVLTNTYPLSEIENYGMFDGAYRKLSDELIQAFQEYSYLETEDKNNEEYDKIINGMISNNRLCYSKKEQGRNMLARLRPDKVASVCGHYFAKTYAELNNF
ncbi:MAG: DUF4276 family protein [Lachnospiraceae bacterium]|nr:DUF4276 family protein [Lachnospiraceae bacterium]